MSNFLAVATVTEALISRVRSAVEAVVPGVEVTSGRPAEGDEEGGDGRVNVFLYQVTPNGALRNADLPSRREGGAVVERPRAALTLHYLLSFSGDAATDVPERLLGAAVARLHTRPLFDREFLDGVIAGQAFLAGSDLPDQLERVRATPASLSLEELSKLWSVFFQAPYRLSAAYEVSVVLVEEDVVAQRALPVRGPFPDPDDPNGRPLDGRRIVAEPFRRPRVDEVVAAEGDDEPLLAGGAMVIRGRRLRAEAVGVTIDGEGVLPPPPAPGETEIALPLTTPPVPEGVLRSGVHALQVVHSRMLGDPAVPHRGVASNVVPFVLRPRITSVVAEELVVVEDEPAAPVLTLEVEPDVGREQRVAVFLNQRAPPGDTPARAYTLDQRVEEASEEEPPEASATVHVRLAGVDPGDYLVRLQVDGAESPLTLGELDGVIRYVEPRVEI